MLHIVLLLVMCALSSCDMDLNMPSGVCDSELYEITVEMDAPEGQDLSEGVTFEDLPDGKSKKRKTASTDYGKVAKAIGDIRAAGINVSLANINRSKFGFAPDVENNRILFGLKGLLNVGDDVVAAIIEQRPLYHLATF